MIQSLIVFDTETTGLLEARPTPLSRQPHIIEFAGIRLEMDVPADGQPAKFIESSRLEFLCKPGKTLATGDFINDKITEFTGIRNEDLKDKEPFAAHYTDLVRFFFGTEYLFAHYLAFDRDMLAIELQRMEKHFQFPWPPHHRCTVEASIGVRGYRLNLQALHEEATGMKFEGAHRAMADVEALVKTLPYLAANELIKWEAGACKSH